MTILSKDVKNFNAKDFNLYKNLIIYSIIIIITNLFSPMKLIDLVFLFSIELFFIILLRFIDLTIKEQQGKLENQYSKNNKKNILVRIFAFITMIIILIVPLMMILMFNNVEGIIGHFSKFLENYYSAVFSLFVSSLFFIKDFIKNEMPKTIQDLQGVIDFVLLIIGPSIIVFTYIVSSMVLHLEEPKLVWGILIAKVLMDIYVTYAIYVHNFNMWNKK